MTTANPLNVKAAVRRLGTGFVKRMKRARKEIREMKSVAESHGRCCPPCEIPKLADYLESVEQQLDWYLKNLDEPQEGK